jgi:hypothetical protein
MKSPVTKLMSAARLLTSTDRGSFRACLRTAIVSVWRPAAFDQFFWTMQLPPAAFRFEHNSLACSAETNGPTIAR